MASVADYLKKREVERARAAVFDKNGSVTAGNSSGLNDGAAYVVLMSANKAKQFNMDMQFIVSFLKKIIKFDISFIFEFGQFFHY